MDVDEAGGDHAIGGVDDLGGVDRAVPEVLDEDDPTVTDADIGSPERGVGSVGDQAGAQQEIHRHPSIWPRSTAAWCRRRPTCDMARLFMRDVGAEMLSAATGLPSAVTMAEPTQREPTSFSSSSTA